MAKTSYQELPVGFDFQYNKALQSSDRFIYSTVRRSNFFTSRDRKKGLTQKSLIVSLAPVWRGFSGGTISAWNAAGAACGLSGFKLFVQDTSKRIANALTGYATPSIYHQSEVGQIHIQSPSTHGKIAQFHPLNYYISKKVKGSRDQREAILVTEDFSLPVSISINYHSVLTSAGTGARARFYVQIHSWYQGRDILTDLNCEFSLSAAWGNITNSISSVLGVVRGYTAFIQIFNCTGDLYFDNVSIVHSGHNWARDPNCNNIKEAFTKLNFQVPAHWVDVDINTGASFASVYYN